MTEPEGEEKVAERAEKPASAETEAGSNDAGHSGDHGNGVEAVRGLPLFHEGEAP